MPPINVSRDTAALVTQFFSGFTGGLHGVADSVLRWACRQPYQIRQSVVTSEHWRKGPEVPDRMRDRPELGRVRFGKFEFGLIQAGRAALEFSPAEQKYLEDLGGEVDAQTAHLGPLPAADDDDDDDEDIFELAVRLPWGERMALVGAMRGIIARANKADDEGDFDDDGDGPDEDSPHGSRDGGGRGGRVTARRLVTKGAGSG